MYRIYDKTLSETRQTMKYNSNTYRSADNRNDEIDVLTVCLSRAEWLDRSIKSLKHETTP